MSTLISDFFRVLVEFKMIKAYNEVEVIEVSDLGNKQIMSENLKRYVAMSGKTRQEICKDLGVNYSTFTEWLNGGAYPRIDKIEMMANYFKIEKSDLVEKRGTRRQLSKMIPVLGRVPAGVPLHAVEDIIDYEEIPESMARLGEHFALRISGSSMEPKISDGDVVIVRKQEDVDNGAIAIVLVNGEDATCKKIRKHENGLTLVSTNPAYEPMYFSNEEVNNKPLVILGKVVELRAKF